MHAGLLCHFQHLFQHSPDMRAVFQSSCSSRPERVTAMQQELTGLSSELKPSHSPSKGEGYLQGRHLDSLELAVVGDGKCCDMPQAIWCGVQAKV